MGRLGGLIHCAGRCQSIAHPPQLLTLSFPPIVVSSRGSGSTEHLFAAEKAKALSPPLDHWKYAHLVAWLGCWAGIYGRVSVRGTASD